MTTTTKYQTYPKYKPSGIDWLGDIPGGWEVKRLKYLCTRVADYGLNIGAENYLSQGVRFIRTSDIDDDGILSEEGVYLDRTIIPNEYLLNSGDILLSRSGTIGRSYCHNNFDEDYTYAGYLVRFTLRLTSLETKFAYYFFHSQSFFEWIKTQLIETTIGNVNGQKYANIPIQTPPLSEQRTIADFLDCETEKIDEVIEKKQKLIELLLEKRQVIISQAVTKGLNPKAKMKGSGISWLGEIPQSWETKPLKRVVQNKVIKGVDKELPFLALEHVISGEGVLIPEYEQEIVKADEYAVFDKGQILFGKLRPYLRKFYRPNFEGCCPTEFLVLSPQKSVSDDYIFYLVQSNYFILLTNATSYGVKMPRTSWEALSPNYIPLPPKDEQIAITDYLNNITLNANLLINKIKIQNQKLQEFRQALISNVVTGKIKV